MKLVVVAVVGLLLCSLAHAQKPEPKPDMDKPLEMLTFTRDYSGAHPLGARFEAPFFRR